MEYDPFTASNSYTSLTIMNAKNPEVSERTKGLVSLVYTQDLKLKHEDRFLFNFTTLANLEDIKRKHPLDRFTAQIVVPPKRTILEGFERLLENTLSQIANAFVIRVFGGSLLDPNSDENLLPYIPKIEEKEVSSQENLTSTHKEITKVRQEVSSQENLTSCLPKVQEEKEVSSQENLTPCLPKVQEKKEVSSQENLTSNAEKEKSSEGSSEETCIDLSFILGNMILKTETEVLIFEHYSSTVYTKDLNNTKYKLYEEDGKLSPQEIIPLEDINKERYTYSLANLATDLYAMFSRNEKLKYVQLNVAYTYDENNVDDKKTLACFRRFCKKTNITFSRSSNKIVAIRQF
jgi:hypothetical protein